MQYVMGSIVLAVAGLCLIPGFLILRKSWQRAAGWTIAYGVVTGAESGGGLSGEANVYLPTVEICCPDGRRYTFRASSGSGRYPSTGATVKVVYNPEDPTEGELFWDLWVWPFVLLLLGSFFLMFAILTYAGSVFAES